jgi:xylan 1,4-beta-xylosidase
VKVALVAVLGVAWLGGPAHAADAGAEARFSYVEYSGQDPRVAGARAAPDTFRNPIIPGFAPDPSVVRVGGDYFLVNSTFAFYPGLPIFHSRDLVSWRQIGNAIDRTDQFNFAGLGIARGIFAPTLRWHDGLFFLIGTCVDCGGNFIITAKEARGPWSAPMWLPTIDGVDPDLFFDDDGGVWIVNSGPPAAAAEYTGHRAIWLQQMDLGRRQTLGPRTVIVNGGSDIRRHPIWVEGPHLYKKDGWYYLVAAEGGTAKDHSETVYRSRTVTGPYGVGPGNPILTQRDLDPGRPNPVAATGHADLVLAGDGRWWAVFLATRPYEANLSNLGRETFLLPVHWIAGWPLILPPAMAVPSVLPRPRLGRSEGAGWERWREDFSAAQLSQDWEMMRTPAMRWYRIESHALILDARPESVSGTANPSFLGKRQRHEDVRVETELRYVPEREGDHAGLLAFADEQHWYFVGLRRFGARSALVVARRDGANTPSDGEAIVSEPFDGRPGEPVRLRIEAHGPRYDFYWAARRGPWRALLAGADGRVLASEPTNLFTGTLIGVVAGRRPEP